MGKWLSFVYLRVETTENSTYTAMTEELILSEIHQLPENMKVEVLHFVQFLR